MRRHFSEHSRIEAFWSRVDRSGGVGLCWPWQGGQEGGYGRLRWGNRHRMAHVMAWVLTHGEPPPDKPCVLHNCPAGDNPLCCNPLHLWVGTRAENNADCRAKGRHNCGRGARASLRLHPESRSFGDRNGARTKPERHARGERGGGAKLTADQVSQIRALHAARTHSNVRIGKMFQISGVQVGNIVRGKSWVEPRPEAQS